jgi:presenilin 1
MFVVCSQILIANNAVMDWVTLAVVVWNFGSVGMVCVHWKGPLLAQQVCVVLVVGFTRSYVFILLV